MNALLASWQNLSLGLERPLHKQISESNCTSYSEKGLVAQTHIFNTIKPLLVLTSSPSRTNTNFNTLQCSFPKPPLKQPLSHPFPRTTPIPPSLLSHNRKSFGASAMAPARLRSLVGRAQRPFWSVFRSKIDQFEIKRLLLLSSTLIGCRCGGARPPGRAAGQCSAS